MAQVASEGRSTTRMRARLFSGESMDGENPRANGIKETGVNGNSHVEECKRTERMIPSIKLDAFLL